SGGWVEATGYLGDGAEVVALQVLHDQEQEVGCGLGVVGHDNVRVREPCGRADLAEEPIGKGGESAKPRRMVFSATRRPMTRGCAKKRFPIPPCASRRRTR